MNRIFAGRIFADHYQFYILDACENFYESMPDWDEENSRKGYITNGRTIFIGTRAHFNDHWLDIYVGDHTPSFDNCERALAINLNIVSGELVIATTLNSVAKIPLKKGSYIAYILTSNIGSDSEDYLTDEELEKSTDFERYTIVLILGKTFEQGVVKGEQYLW